MKKNALKNKNILVTGGAGFIGSNLCEYLINSGANVRCLDNLSTGNINNINNLISAKNFTFVEGDIRDLKTCINSCKNIEYVLHQAALGSVPRSINDPITTNEVNIGGFLNMLVASKENNIKKFIYAASSSTYGDSKTLPKVEDSIGKPLSPYAITKYVNELYAENFSTTYGLDTIGLRYFNVFGRRQSPNGAYAAVIPKFVKLLMNHKSPVINGDGTYSRDFTYIDNVIQMNVLAITSKNKESLNKVYNTAVGDRTNLKELVFYLKKYLSNYDSDILDIEIMYGPKRPGDIPHSLASIKKASEFLGYKPSHGIEEGIKESIEWYYMNLK